MSRILVVDYSRTGNTHLVAKAIARGCGADLERIRDVRSRRGIVGLYPLGARGDEGAAGRDPSPEARPRRL